MLDLLNATIEASSAIGSLEYILVPMFVLYGWALAELMFHIIKPLDNSNDT